MVERLILAKLIIKIPEGARQCIDRFRYWYKQLIDNAAMVAASYDKKTQI